MKVGKAIGVEIRAAVRRAPAWGEAAACGAGDGVLILPHTLKKARTRAEDDSLGVYFAHESEPGEVRVEGDVPMYLRYDGLDLPIALAMGATGGAPVRQGTTSAYAQSFSLADSLDGLFATFALYNQINVQEYASLKLSGLTLKGEAGRPLEVSFHALAADQNGSSTVNTADTFESVTWGETGNRVLFSQGSVRLNGRDDAALGAGDVVHPSRFELSLKRKLRGVYGVSSQADTVDEPSSDGRPEVRLTLEFPRYSSKTHFSNWDQDAPMKLDMAFTGASIEAPYNREFRLMLPHLRYAGADLPMERGILRHPVEFLCHAAGSAPAGMSGVTQPFRISVINTRSADVLA